MANLKTLTASGGPLSWLGRLAWPAATILALALPALRPILQPDLPCTDDAAFHLLRLTQLDHLISQGVWYSRIAPDMAHGYGYMLFNFYAPLSYYAAELVSFLAGNLHLSLRLTFALGLLLSGMAMYAWAREHVGRGGALVAAVAYMYAPYQAYDVLFRGNLAESFAWWLMPLMLYCLERLSRRGGARWLAATAVSYAALLLSHNVFALIFSPLLVLYAIWQVGMANTRRQGTAIQIGASLVLGLALTAFFWLPALAERELVQAERALTPPDFVYWGNYLKLKEILAWPQRAQPGLINPSPARALGAIQFILASPSLLYWRRPRDRGWRHRSKQRRQILFLWALLMGMIWLVTAASRPLWDRIPLIQFVQFPWRWLGPAALLLSLLIGYAAEYVQNWLPARIERWWPAIMCCLLITVTVFWLSPTYCPGLEDPTVSDIAAFEWDTGLIGTTASGEFLPDWVERLPDEAYREPFSSGEDVALAQVERTPLSLSAQAQASEPSQIVVNVISYPGWRAKVDGEPVALGRQEATGLITLQLPAGEHQIMVFFAETRLRLAADLISVSGILVVAGMLAAALVRRRAPGKPVAPSIPVDEASILGAGTLWRAAIAGLFSLVLLWPADPLLYKQGVPSGADEDIVRYEGEFTLASWEREGAGSQPLNEPLAINLTWMAQARQDRNLRATVRLRGAEGQYWSAKETARPRSFRPAYGTQLWQEGQYAQDWHLVPALPATPPGEYVLELTLFDESSLSPIRLADGRLTLDLAAVEFTRPGGRLPEPQFRVKHDFARGGGPVSLFGYNYDRLQARPGDPLLITTFLQSQDADQEYQLEFRLFGPDGRQVVSYERPPAGADWPVTAWLEGEIWRGQHLFRLPAALVDGSHRWQLCLDSRAGSKEGTQETEDLCIDLSPIELAAPLRLYDQPEGIATIGARFEKGLTLAGLKEPIPTSLSASSLPFPLSIGLVWTAEGSEVETSYRVFVHVIDASGRPLAQSDAEPGQWTRPTTGWVAGEYIIDEHELVLEPRQFGAGRYEVIAGLYDPQTGDRLRLLDGSSTVSIGWLEVKK